MSRIAGIISAKDQTYSKNMTGRMLAMLPGKKKKLAAGNGVCLGWSGNTDGAIHKENGYITVLDGQIFNIKEIKNLLYEHGSDNPAEILHALYQKCGFAEALKRINGDFAIAVYDKKNNRLWLGRDRFGVRPLYFSNVDHGLVFASQPWALLANPDVPADVNPRFTAVFASSHYRLFDNHPQESAYSTISQLPAGSYLEYNPKSFRQGIYWKLEERDELCKSQKYLAESYRELFLDSVQIRIKSGGNNAFTLSGGMDSSSIVACAHEIEGRGQTAYSAVYDDPTFDESEQIEPMLLNKVTSWRQVKISNDIDVFSSIDKMVNVHNEPIPTATWLSHESICNQASRDGITTLFGGLGGDELNAGEYEYFPFHFADLLSAGKDGILNEEIAAWVKHHDHPIYKKSKDVAKQEIARLTNGSNPGLCLADFRRINRYQHTLNPDFYDLRGTPINMEHPFRSCLKNRTYQDIFFETLPCCLRAEDRNTTALGLNQFNPFLDHRLAEFMFRIKGKHKIRKGVTKILLRRAMKGLLPEETRNRVQKVGWNAPAHQWFSGHQLERIRDIVESTDFQKMGIYRPNIVTTIIDEHEEIIKSAEPKENHMMFLWQLLNLQIWMGANNQIKSEIERKIGIAGIHDKFSV